MGRVSSAGRPSGDRYEIQERIAAGGMGAIHRAYDRLARREVAYKRLVVVNEASRARITLLFQREYDTLAHLAHPNIVETFDYGQDSDGPYYTMELLTGRDLTRVAPLPYREACRILRDVASALALVHARRLIHRDISPSNIRLTGEGRAKVIDFGALTAFGKPEELVGTASCMAPECLSEAPLDQRTDLYSLGAVAYWLLTHKTSVRARSIKELAEAFTEPVVAPSLLAAGIPEELDALVLSLLAHDPLARPVNAAYVIEKLTTIAELPPETEERRVAYSYLAHPPLSGRLEALSSLENTLAQAAEGRGNVALVEARAGLGRSALLDTLALGAQLDGFVVLRASGDRRAGPFGLSRKLMDFAYTLYHDLTPGQVKGQSILTYQSHKAQSAADVAAHHALVVAAVRRALFELTQRSPVALVLDDLHECDPESLALLASLREELGEHRLALVASSLTDSDAEDLPGHSLIRAKAKRIVLAPLSEEETVEMVQSVFGDVPNTRRLGQWLHAQSGGNPATSMDLARLLLARGAIRYTLGTFTLPHTLEANLSTDDLSNAILARLGSLGPHAHRVASALSLHEGTLTPEQLASALDLPPRDVLLSLEELSARRVVTQHETGFSLTASSLRTTLELQLTQQDRQDLHVQLAHSLLSHGQGLTEASFQASTHLLRGGRETEAADIVASLGRGGLNGESAARWVVLIEAVLSVFAKQKRSKEQQLALLIPLMHAGFYGELEAQRRHIEDALAWMSSVCGMTLARRMRPWFGGKIALLLGLLYAVLRRAFTPKKQRLGTLPEMLAEFVGLVSAGTAAAVSADDTVSAARWNQSLEPLSALPPHTSGFLLREFCLATVEVGRGELRASAARYKRLMPALLKPIEGLDDALRLTIYRGCLNGRTLAELQEPGGGALVLAEELLGAGDPFFAPHAECSRMGYYAYRGDRDKAEYHRAQAELFALRGGNSWSAETITARRQVITAILTHDAIGLVQAMATVERLQDIAPKMDRYRAFCEAWLEYLRGRPAEGVALYERFIDNEGADHFYSWRFDRACYAALLNATGQHQRAKAVCAELLRDHSDLSALTDFLHLALPQLSLAEAGLGHLLEATRLMELHLANVRGMGNPMLLGSAHRDRAQIALLDGDSASFEEHFEGMANCFRATRNPSLIQQCDKLATQAVSRGLRTAVTPLGFPLAQEVDSTTALVTAGELSLIRMAAPTEPMLREPAEGDARR
jgi:hypothetical protein